MEKVVKGDEKEPKLNQNENDYTEQYKGLIMLRKGKLEEKEVWFATVGQMLISDGAFGSKKELIDNIENLTLDRVCKIMIGVANRILKLEDEKEPKLSQNENDYTEQYKGLIMLRKGKLEAEWIFNVFSCFNRIFYL